MRVFLICLYCIVGHYVSGQKKVLEISSDVIGVPKKESIEYMKNLGYKKFTRNSFDEDILYQFKVGQSITGLNFSFKKDKLIEINNTYVFESIYESKETLNSIITDLINDIGEPRYYFGIRGVIPSLTYTLEESKSKVNLMTFGSLDEHVYFWLLDDRTIYLSQNFGKRVKFSVQLNPYYR